MTGKPKKALVVLGMHRSGVSVLSRCLNILGLPAGNSFMAMDPNGQTDSFQSRNIILLHDILFRDIGFKWDMVGALPPDWTEKKIVSHTREKIVNLIKRNFSESSLWAVHDPRLCRLMPLWLDAFKQENIEPCFVLMVRHPYEVVKSLETSDGFDQLKGHLLWLTYNREALAACRGYSHVILTYDGLLADPVGCLETISRRLSVDCFKDYENSHQSIIDFVRSELKHHNWGGVDRNEHGMFAQYAWLYDQFKNQEARAMEQFASDDDPSAMIPNEALEKALAIVDVSPVQRGNDHTMAAELSPVPKMFNDLLKVISRFEQAELDRDVQRQRLLLTADQPAGALYAQVYFPTADNELVYVEEDSKKILLAPVEWQKISVAMPAPERLRQQQLRFDPLNTRGLIKISAIRLIDEIDGHTLWAADGDIGFQTCTIEGHSLLLGTDKYIHICATGTDPYILLPTIVDLPDTPMRLEVWIKVQHDLGELKSEWDEKENNAKSMLAELKNAGLKIEELERKLETSSRIQAKDEKTISDYRLKLDELSRIRTNNEKTISDYRLKLDELSRIRTNNEKTISDYRLKLDELSRIRTNNEKTISDYRLKLDELSRIRTNNEKTISDYRLKLDELSRIRTNNEKTISDFSFRLDESKKYHEVEINALKNQMAVQNATDQQKIQKLEEKFNQTQSQIKKKDDLLKEYFTELAETEKNNIINIERLEHKQRIQEEAGHQQLQALESRLSKAYKDIGEKEDLISKYIKSWSTQLNRNLKILVSSKRWFISNKLLSILSLGFLRIRKQTALESLEVRSQSVENILLGTINDMNSLSDLNRQINEEFYALLDSRRWRAAHIDLELWNFLFKNKSIGVVERIKILLEQFQDLMQIKRDYKNCHLEESGFVPDSFSYTMADVDMLKQLIQELSMNIETITRSKRWSMGNKIIFILSFGILKIKKQTALESLSLRIKEIKNQSYSLENSTDIIVYVTKRIQGDLDAITNSVRWRFLHYGVNTLPHNKISMAIDSANKNIKKIKEWCEKETINYVNWN